jgi:uncharacterized protein (DUF433 family)
MTVDTNYQHVVLDEKGIPYVEGTRIKVVELVLDHKAYGWSPEELHFQHPQLTLGQIHSALAYYWDHQDELEADMQERMARACELREKSAASPLQSRLKDS